LKSGATRSRATGANHAQPGDPAKLAKAIIRLVNPPNSPFRMPFGSDTVAAIEEKNATVAAELTQWRDLSLSTDFASGTREPAAPPARRPS
jgi:hypothetical protein